MDRQTVYRGQEPFETDILLSQRFGYEALGLLSMDMLGVTTSIAGLIVSATAPASMTLNVGPGRIYAIANLEPGPWGAIVGTGGLPTDTDPNHNILKQGINRSSVPFTFAAPTVAGQAINYLIQATFLEIDAAGVVSQFYNSANPSAPIATSISPSRLDQCSLSVKSGVATTTGSQTTPAPDVGYVGAWVVTIPYGTTTLTAANVSQYLTAPFLVPNQGRLINFQTFVTIGATAYQPSPGTKMCLVRGQGGGGAGASTPAIAAGSALGVAQGGGAAGGYFEAYVPVAALVGQIVTIGAGGIATGPPNPGGNGGSTSFGTLFTALGGAGGNYGNPSATNILIPGGKGGDVSGGNVFNRRGGGGLSGTYTNSGSILSGAGADSLFGCGGLSVSNGSGNNGGPGGPGQGNGSGGAGATGLTSSSLASPGYFGGVGAPGVVFVWEYA